MQSVWSDTAAGEEYRSLNGDITADVLVVGGGMAGVLCARMLTDRGVNCALVEARRLGGGVTRNTTAKITAQHGFIYADIIRRFGAEAARLHLRAHTDAIARYKALSALHPCDYEEKAAYVYTMDDAKALEREAAAYQTLGLNASVIRALPLPFEPLGALQMDNQAQFNPLKLLYGCARGLTVYENTCVRHIDENRAVTDGGTVTARHIVLATHFPMVNIPGLYFMKLYQHRSYVLALEKAPALDGIYVDERGNGHSFRNYKDLLFIGGGDHRTGKRGGGLDELRALAARAYPGARQRYAWAAQDCMTLDGLPYIGRHRRGDARLYAATGFNKWGMTSSMVAASLIADLIVSGASEYEALYSPQRTMLRPQLFANAASSALGLLSIGGPRCAHMGCKLRWNAREHTWDCACHGSRFTKQGALIDNPAAKGIKP